MTFDDAALMPNVNNLAIIIECELWPLGKFDCSAISNRLPINQPHRPSSKLRPNLEKICFSSVRGGGGFMYRLEALANVQFGKS